MRDMTPICRPPLLVCILAIAIALQSHAAPQPTNVQSDPSRNPGNSLFDETGVLVGSADAMPIDHFGDKMKRSGVKWLALQIDNGGKKREDNIAAI
ncbi:MAG: hypothetical protein JWO95_2925, partial [Verrucomicrobiales bacterium]|nr:hypothetical protein [Verrucomicrobiales bacterium]